MNIRRRSFLAGLAAALAAPAIVRAESIMTVRRPLLILPQHIVDLGFPNRHAPIGSTWFQKGATYHVRYVMDADGFWKPTGRPVKIEHLANVHGPTGNLPFDNLMIEIGRL